MSRLLCSLGSRHGLCLSDITRSHLRQWVRHHLRSRRREPVRKPIWTPIAPSKLFRIRQKPVLSEAEEAQRQHMDTVYATNMRSIQDYFHHEFYAPTLSAGGLSEEQIRSEQLNQMEVLEANDRENERIAGLREQRMKKLSEMMDQKIVVEYLQQTERYKEKGRQLDEKVRQEVKRSETYITSDTLEAAIEEALTHAITYDFAIDIDGNIHSDQPLHPYALRPGAVPEMSSNVQELSLMDEMPAKFNPKTLY